MALTLDIDIVIIVNIIVNSTSMHIIISVINLSLVVSICRRG